MSQTQRVLLQMVDPLSVSMIAIDGAVIRLMVSGTLKRFDFDSPEAARSAFEEWIQANPKVEKH